jgi:exodeoxyribonuclease-5
MKKRQYLGIEGPPRRGEPLVCMKNNHRIGILNGAVYELAADVDPCDPTIFINIDGYEEEIEMATIEGVSRDFKNEQYEEGWSPFAFGYALTVHRSQGSEWNKVILVDECFNEDRKAVLYTGITRAAHSIIVISR